MVKQNKIAKIALVASLLAFFVVGLGAYTRLTDSGLGCPDWPGCYGQLAISSAGPDVLQAQLAYPQQQVEPSKAWNEMFHRYVAGTLGLLMVALAFMLMRYTRRSLSVRVLPWFLLALLGFQAALGMWTVTWQLLPLVVMGHLLGGLLILSSLWLIFLRMRNIQRPVLSMTRIKPWALVGLVLVFLQIALGGWTSSNYAAMSCPDFPMCNGAWIPHLNLHDAFNLFAPIGHNYEGGHLDGIARVTIHFVHRIGAIVVAVYVFGLALAILRSPALKSARRLAWFMLGLLTLQLILGAINAMYLPVFVAVGHNLVAAILLLVVLTLNYRLFSKSADIIPGAHYG